MALYNSIIPSFPLCFIWFLYIKVVLIIFEQWLLLLATKLDVCTISSGSEYSTQTTRLHMYFTILCRFYDGNSEESCTIEPFTTPPVYICAQLPMWKLREWLSYSNIMLSDGYLWPLASFTYSNGLTLFPAWIRNYMAREMWVQFHYPFLNLNGCTVKV